MLYIFGSPVRPGPGAGAGPGPGLRPRPRPAAPKVSELYGKKERKRNNNNAVEGLWLASEKNQKLKNRRKKKKTQLAPLTTALGLV